MHGSLASNARLLDALKAGLKHAEGVDCAVCAPFPYLAQVSAALSGSTKAPARKRTTATRKRSSTAKTGGSSPG